MRFSLSAFLLSASAVLLFALATPAPLSAQEAAPAGADATPAGGLRRLDQPAAPENPDADQTAPAPARRNSRGSVAAHQGRAGSQRVMFFNDLHIQEDEDIGGQAVVIGGNLTVDGVVESQAVAIMGDVTINGAVHGQVVCVLGNVTLGPRAHVDGQVVCTGGTIDKSPGAYVGGQIVQNSFGARHSHGSGPGMQAWYAECLLKGRPLAFGPHLGWLWMWTAGAFALYVLLALIFPGGIRRCGDTLVQRPGLVILSAVLSCLAIPILFVLLCATVVGIPVAFLLPLGIAIAIAFGKTSLFALIGRRISQDRVSPAVAVLLGGAICVLIYTAPYFGILVSLLLAALSLGCTVTALFASSRADGPRANAVPPASAPVPLVAPMVPVMPAAAEPAPTVSPAPAAVPADVPSLPVLPPVAIASLPRAGFWIRTAALLVDMILVGVIANFIPHFEGAPAPSHFEGIRFTTGHSGHWIFLLLPAYAVILWKLKGSTIGGIVFRLKVARLDGRPIDWATAIVRGLGSYLSFICIGLGFIWVAFDSERQSWHDKIAGTTVVRPPHGISLI